MNFVYYFFYNSILYQRNTYGEWTVNSKHLIKFISLCQYTVNEKKEAIVFAVVGVQRGDSSQVFNRIITTEPACAYRTFPLKKCQSSKNNIIDKKAIKIYARMLNGFQQLKILLKVAKSKFNILKIEQQVSTIKMILIFFSCSTI